GILTGRPPGSDIGASRGGLEQIARAGRFAPRGPSTDGSLASPRQTTVGRLWANLALERQGPLRMLDSQPPTGTSVSDLAAERQDDLIITRGASGAAARAVQRRCVAGELARLAPGIYV